MKLGRKKGGSDVTGIGGTILGIKFDQSIL